MKLRIKSVIWYIRKQKTTNQKRKKKKESKKMNIVKGPSGQCIIKYTNIPIIGASEGGEREQETGNLFEKIMTENFSN